MTPPPSAQGISTELVVLARQGDPQALRSLVLVAHPLVRRWALVQTGDPADADDLTQDVLVHMIRRLDRFEGRSAFTTWLYAVTRNAARDHQRARARRERMAERFQDVSRNEAGASRDPTVDALLERAAGVPVELTWGEGTSAATRRALSAPRAWIPLAAAAAIAAVLLVTGNPAPRPLPAVARAETSVLVEAASARGVAIIETENPNITVLWFFEEGT